MSEQNDVQGGYARFSANSPPSDGAFDGIATMRFDPTFSGLEVSVSGVDRHLVQPDGQRTRLPSGGVITNDNSFLPPGMQIEMTPSGAKAGVEVYLSEEERDGARLADGPHYGVATWQTTSDAPPETFSVECTFSEGPGGDYRLAAHEVPHYRDGQMVNQRRQLSLTTDASPQEWLGENLPGLDEA